MWASGSRWVMKMLRLVFQQVFIYLETSPKTSKLQNKDSKKLWVRGNLLLDILTFLFIKNIKKRKNKKFWGRLVLNEHRTTNRLVSVDTTSPHHCVDRHYYQTIGNTRISLINFQLLFISFTNLRLYNTGDNFVYV